MIKTCYEPAMKLKWIEKEIWSTPRWIYVEAKTITSSVQKAWAIVFIKDNGTFYASHYPQKEFDSLEDAKAFCEKYAHKKIKRRIKELTDMLNERTK